ncbi:MAG: hypothetical protein K2P19_09590, partial [Kineothrix sp.]|nr:hypothetical protein [Kineothrix sp.]
MGCSVLVLFLYVLSFFRILSFSDYVAVAVVAAAAVYAIIVYKKSKADGRNMLRFIRRELLSASSLTALAMAVIVTACVSAKAVSWWDDYNFWATDVKALFY